MSPDNEQALNLCSDADYLPRNPEGPAGNLIAQELAAHTRRMYAEIEAKDAKIAELQLQLDKFSVIACKESNKSASRIAELEKYVMHRIGCNCTRASQYRRGDACDCGLAELLAKKESPRG